MKAHRTTNPPEPAAVALRGTPRGTPRGTMLAIAAALVLVVTLAYAGPMWATALHLLLTDGIVVLLWLGAAIGIGLLFVPSFVTAAALGLGVMSLAILGLGLAGLLNRYTAWTMIGVGLVLLIVRTFPRRDSLAVWLRERADWSWVWLLIAPLLAMATVAALMPPGILWSPDDPHPYDVVEYHLQIPREWYEAGRIVPLAHNVFSYFPFNVEMQYLLAMHLRGGPWAGMYVAQLMHVAYVALSIVAVYSMSRQWTGRAGASMAALATAAAPWVWLLGPVGYNEGGLLLYGTLAIGHALAAIVSEEGRLRRFAIAGAMAGFACGVKLTAAPLLLVGIPISIVAATRLRVPWKGLAIFIVTGVLTFAPWLVRNVVWAGNPVFPEAQRVFGRAHFSEAQSERWRRAHAPAEGQTAVLARISAFVKQIVFDWRYGFALLPLAAIAAGMDRSPRAILLATLLLVVIVFWVGFTHLQGRFFVLAIPIAAMLIGFLEPWRKYVTPVLACALVVGFVKLHQRLTSYPLDAALGVDTLEWAQPAVLQNIPGDRPVTLAGDARAFLYEIPMSRLRYRTVFDVDVRKGEDVVNAWVRGSARHAVIAVDPIELGRFARTYYGIPDLSENLRGKTQTFIVESEDAAR